MRKRAHEHSYSTRHSHPFELQAALFRAMAGEYSEKDPMVSVTMRESADFFETLATEVQAAAEDIDLKARLFVRPFLRCSVGRMDEGTDA
jgi:hypothetical protein